MQPRPDPLPYPSVLTWLPVFWSRVLFPGRLAEPTAPRWSSLLWLVLLPSVLLYPCLSFPLLEPDEGRYAQIPREMMQRGEWVVPLLQDEPYLDKPPLMYWLVQASYHVLGVHDWSARLVPAVAVHLGILATYLLGRRLVGERGAFWGALLLGLAPGFITVGRLLLLDGLLSLWVVLALLGGFEAVRGERLRWGWWAVLSLACGLGVLTKGPVAVLLVLPPLWLHLKLTHAPVRMDWRAALVFVAGILAVNLPWYLLATWRMPGFAQHFLIKHNLQRFLDPFDHVQPVWYYGPVLLLGLLPGTLLLWPFLRFLLGGEAARRRSPEMGFLLLAAGWCVLFFSLSGSKLPTYILPAFPPLCLAVGAFVAGGRWNRSPWPRAVAVAGFLLLGLVHHVLVPWYAWYRSPMRQPNVIRRYCEDRSTPVICYPRNVDSVAFYLGRSDLRSVRGKEVDELRAALLSRPRTVVLCTHRHTLTGLRQTLPPELAVTETVHFGLPPVPGVPPWLEEKVMDLGGETAWGLSDLAVVERKQKKVTQRRKGRKGRQGRRCL